MKKNIRSLGAAVAIATCVFSSQAIPAKPGPISIEQPDGSSITVRLTGDESFHQYFSVDGFPLVERDGYFYYADITADGQVEDSGIRAGAPGARSAETIAFLSKIDLSGLSERIATRAALSPRMVQTVARRQTALKSAALRAAASADGPPYEMGYGLFADQSFPAYGDQKGIVILVEYQDVKFRDPYDNDVTAFDYFTRMLNEEGFSDYGATGSARDYFRLNSNDAFRPQFDVYGPLTLDNNMSYYGKNDAWGDDLYPAAMVKEACDQLESSVDFSEYDRDGDGYVDNIFIIYAGYGENAGGGSTSVWPHSWNMTEAGYSDEECTYDGVQVFTYGCTNEWTTSGRPDGVGTFIHEFSHVMGLPDLYATSYTNAFTPGNWSCLATGPYNNDGMTPPLYGAYERYSLGWIKPSEITGELSATLPPISENRCGIIRTDTDTEFFLLENRQQEGWDEFIPGHGMLVWHIDYDESIWDKNIVNNLASHQYVDIVEADGTRTSGSRAGDAFPGTSNVTSFTASTTPALETWDGSAIDLPITDIAETDGLITFNVCGGGDTSELTAPMLNDPDLVTTESFHLSWLGDDGLDAWVNVFAGSLSEPQYVDGYREAYVSDAAEITVEGLESDTQYMFTVALTDGWKTSPLAWGSVVTGELSALKGISDGDPSFSLTVCGRTVACPGNLYMVVADVAGRVVAQGTDTLEIPQAGVYVVSVPSRGIVRKLAVR